MAPAIAPRLIDPAKQHDCLVQHIPHRVRAVLPGIPMRGQWALPALIFQGPSVNAVAVRCIGNSIWEGRHTGLRWLIEFVGIIQSAGLPAAFSLKRGEFDMRIDRMAGGVVIARTSPEAKILAPVWKGCTQASSHPTMDTNHPEIREPILADALHIVVEHLQRTIYAHAGLKIIDEVMRADGP